MMGDATTVKISKSVEESIADDFRKSFFMDWDWRFLAILFICVFIEGVVVYILAQRPVPEYSAREIARIQERFANFVLGEDLDRRRTGAIASSTGTAMSEGEEGVSEELGEGGEGEGEGEGTGGDEGGTGTGDGTGEGDAGGFRRPTRVEAAEARRRTREAISREVSNRGILGLLTGTGRAAEGEAVSSLFTSSGTGTGADEDLDKVLSSVNGLRAQGGLESGGGGGGGGGEGGGGGLRGTRSGRQATIDDLVTESGGVRSQSLSRRGELIIEAPAEVAGRGRKSIYRSPEAIQEVLLSHNAAIRYCYERELKRNPSLKGKISIRITLSPDGKVKDATIVTSTLNSERVERCIIARIRLWKDFKPIDPSEGDVTFRQVYTFGY